MNKLCLTFVLLLSTCAPAYAQGPYDNPPPVVVDPPPEPETPVEPPKEPPTVPVPQPPTLTLPDSDNGPVDPYQRQYWTGQCHVVDGKIVTHTAWGFETFEYRQYMAHKQCKELIKKKEQQV